MATAIVKTETKLVSEEVQQQVVKLELTIDEAEFIHSMTWKIGGHPDTTYRYISDALRAALRHTGVACDFQKYFADGGFFCGPRP